MKWRYEGKLDSVLHDPRPHLLDIRSSMDNHCEHKYDKFGRPIYIEVRHILHLVIPYNHN
jgi:hypothetical protein